MCQYIKRPGLIASLACLASVFNPTDIGNRFQTTLALLLTLTAINYATSDALPTLPYLTRLDKYHDMCHNLVFVIIAQNVVFYAWCQLTMQCTGEEVC